MRLRRGRGRGGEMVKAKALGSHSILVVMGLFVALYAYKEKEMTEEEPVPMFDETTIKAQRAARSENWRLFKEIFEEDKRRLVERFDLERNTAIHVATRSNNPGLLRELLEMLSEKERWHALRKGNCVNNTLLHEIVLGTAVEMAGVVLEFGKEAAPEDISEDIPEENKRGPLLEIKNGSVLPEEGYEIHDDDDENGSADYTRQRNDIESGQQQDKEKFHSSGSPGHEKYHACAAFDGIGRIWQLKKQHKLAEHLSELLVQKDFSWQISYHENLQPFIMTPVLSKSDRMKHSHHTKVMHKTNSQMSRSTSYRSITTETTIPHSKNYTPLLLAAGSGIVEIVGKIIDRFPDAICHVSQDEHNVLHMAVKHRQLKIFNMLRKHSAFKSLIFRITAEGRTLLHQISRMEFYVEQHLPGVAFQLQDELRWYERVKHIVPTYYLMHCDKDGLTAEDVLEMEHGEMHKEAKGWIKETAQSCSTVAVLIATVVFAAAYTIPGGTNQTTGFPMFLGSRLFLFYTVSDVVALVSSLASVVMFLSILTSPFELWDFRSTLPRKLSLGFAFLFFSLVCTMLTLSATVLLTIRLGNHQKWAYVLFGCAVFFPVVIFWRMQFPLCKMFQRLAQRLFKKLRRAVPNFLCQIFQEKASDKKLSRDIND
ncbi:hypothetical protein DEO72_LG3g3300 [Vigna unguiculata]|uniref:PGG domain-containing protein n=1 Tax=Vigna unguiculata TaxID=3917 RepID=A0A4D6LJP3_VIGUN|nr:hypothetical protein DEO72_LG3g3300 [Vigna unguiculata]